MTAVDVPPSELNQHTTDVPSLAHPISVNLLPGEITAARLGRQARVAAVGALIVAVVGVGGWYYTASRAASDAQSQLDSAAAASAVTEHGKSKYATLTRTHAQIDTLRSELASAMTGNVAWSTVFSDVRRVAPSGIGITSLTATTAEQVVPSVPAPTDTSGTAPSSSDAGGTTGGTTTTVVPADTPVGSLIIAGTAQTRDQVSRYAAALGQIKGFDSPLVTNVAASTSTTKADAPLTFGIQLDVSSPLLDTRYKAGN